MAFLQKITQLLKKDIIKVSSWTGVSAIIRIATQFLSAKVLAVMVGPPGIALLGQLSNALGIFMALSTGAITVGVTKFIAEYKEDNDKQIFFIQTATTIIGICSFITAIIVLFAAEYIGTILFHNSSYTSIIYLIGFTIILYAFNTLWVSILNGYSKFKKIVIINIISSVIGLIITILSVYCFGIIGAMVSFISVQTFICFITYFFIRKEAWWKIKKRFYFNKEISKKLAGFSLMSAVAALATPLAQIVSRKFITIHFSLNEAGIWEGMNRISTTYLLLVSSTISVYYLPKLASLKKANELKREILNTFKIVLPILLSINIIVYILKDLIITILFSHDFISMNNLFGFQLMGDFVKISSLLVGYMMWAKGYVKEFIISEIVFAILYVLILKLCANEFGFKGTAIAYFINYTLYFICISYIVKTKMYKAQV